MRQLDKIWKNQAFLVKKSYQKIQPIIFFTNFAKF